MNDMSSLKRVPLPPEAAPELIEDVNFDDEREWMPTGENISVRPLFFNVLQACG